MESGNDNILKLTQQDKRRVSKLGGRIKSVTELFSAALEKAESSGWLESLQAALPWAGVITESAAEALPPVKFLVALCEKLAKETDPELLGHMALTIAYERAVEKAIQQVGGPTEEKRAVKEAKDQLAQMEPCEDVDIGSFSFEKALDHEFVRRADIHFQVAAIAVGYSGAQITRLINEVHDRFVACLKALLSDGETKDKFEPFARYMQLNTKERQAYKALSEHAQYTGRRASLIASCRCA